MFFFIANTMSVNGVQHWLRRKTKVIQVCNDTCVSKWSQNNILSKSLFLFSLHTKSILVASYNYGWTTDVTWTILTMSLQTFWALNVSIVLLSMERQKALGFHRKYLKLFSEDERRFYYIFRSVLFMLRAKGEGWYMYSIFKDLFGDNKQHK